MGYVSDLSPLTISFIDSTDLLDLITLFACVCPSSPDHNLQSVSATPHYATWTLKFLDLKPSSSGLGDRPWLWRDLVDPCSHSHSLPSSGKYNSDVA